MPRIQKFAQYVQRLAAPYVPLIDESDDLPEQDAFLADRPTENYPAYRATAIYGYAPFESRPGR